MTILETSSLPTLLSRDLQEHARRYVTARRRSGEALLEAVAELAAARQQAKHGEWGVFLEAVGLDESAARSQIRIHELASADPAFAERIRTGFLTEATARELLSAPPDVRAGLLANHQPPTRQEIREAKREPAPVLRPTPAPIPVEFRDPEPEPLPADFAEWQERVAAFGQGYRLHHDGSEFVIERPERSPLYAANWYKVEAWIVDTEHGQRVAASAPMPEPEVLPADLIAQVHALGAHLVPATGPEGGWVPVWPGEDATQMIGYDAPALREWLDIDGPHLAAQHGITLELPLLSAPAPIAQPGPFRPPNWKTASTTMGVHVQADTTPDICAMAGMTYTAHLFRIARYRRALPVAADIEYDLLDIEQSILEQNTHLLAKRLNDLESHLHDSADILPDAFYERYVMRIAAAREALVKVGPR